MGLNTEAETEKPKRVGVLFPKFFATMEEIIKVKFFSRVCDSNGKEMVISVRDNELTLEQLKDNDLNQTWTLIPNLASGANTGGYTLYHAKTSKCVIQPKESEPIKLENGRPFGDPDFCWTLWPAGEGNSQLLWTVQAFNAGLVMDLEQSNCKDGGRILFWKWDQSDNQRWIIKRV